jgi:hypothetical protein
MPRFAPLFSLCTLALLSVGGSAFADSCRENLLDERVGMIDMGSTVRAETLSSREAINLLDQASGLSFQRVVPDFWRVKVRRSIDPLDLEVRYQVQGGGDRTGFAVHRDKDNQSFAVRLIPDQPRILCEDSAYRIISGGFTALARASGIGMAGLYALEIDVDVSER